MREYDTVIYVKFIEADTKLALKITTMYHGSGE